MKRQFQKVEEKQQKKQVTRGQSVATEVRTPPLLTSDARVNSDALDSFRSHHDADNRLQKLKQQKIALPVDTSSDKVAAPSTIPQCQLCQRVARALHPDYGYRVPKFYDTQDRRFVRVCSWQEILRNENCPTCSRVAELLSIELQSHGGDPRSAKYDFSLYDYSNTTLFLTLVLELSGLEHFFSISPLPRGIPERAGVLMDQCWIDFERVLQWIKKLRHYACRMSLGHLRSGRIILQPEHVSDLCPQKMSRQGKWRREIHCTELRVGNYKAKAALMKQELETIFQVR